MSIPRAEKLLRLSGPAMVVIVFAAVLACYWPAVHGEILWDDPAHLTSPDLRSWSGLWRIWFELGATQQYYPVVHTAFWIEHRLWGDSVAGYHLTNIFLHAASCCLLAIALRRLWAWGKPPPATDTNRRHLPGIEWLAAILVAVHPVCVESVAWISEQKNTLSFFFLLLAALAYLNFYDHPRFRSYLLASLLFLLAIGAKTVTAILPAAMLVLIWWRNGRLAWRRDVFPLLPWVVVAATGGLFTAWVERTQIGAQGAHFDLTVVQRVLLASRDICFYAGKLVLPTELTFFYPRWDVPRDSGNWIGYLLTVVAITVSCFWFRRRLRGPLAAWLLFVGSLFPALGFFNVYPFVFSYVADHFQYIACAVFIAAAVSGLAVITAKSIFWARTAIVIVGTLIAGLFGHLTWEQSGLYRDVETLFRHTVATVPQSWMAHHNLGLAISASRDRAPEAIAEFRKAMALNPDFPETHFALGRELMKQPGSQSEAVAQLQQALHLRPHYAEANSALGMYLAKQPGRLAEAISHFEDALNVRPKNAEIHLSFANALATGPAHLPEAIAHFEEAIHLRPDLARAHNDYGVVLAKLPDHRGDAIQHFEQALKLEPRYAEAHYNLANALAEMPGQAADAINHYTQALAIEPESAPAHYGLANVLAFRPSRAAEAISHYESALRIQPSFAEARGNLANVLSHLPGRAAEAIANYEAALKIDPSLPWVHFNLGLQLAQIPGRADDAAAHYEEALRLKPDYTDALNGLAILFAQAGNFGAARVQWQKALAIDPNYRVARENLRRLESMPARPR